MSSTNPTSAPNTRWDRLQQLFSEALEIPLADREAYVTSKAANEPDLAQEVLALLACDVGPATGPLTHAMGAAIDATTRDRRKALLGTVIGNYRLTSILGHGGTGTVYLGERSDQQYSAQVAVKIVDSAAVHPDLGLRFRSERQILANLNHPNIARLVDAGETPDGRPYLIMEYIHGEPVDRYCDAHSLTIDQRLDLFLTICGAVQYAHQNLIVHRDLKPANVMVTAEGAPKLLDFGIAKLLDAGNAGALLALTRMSDRLLTPEYASPEQILGRPVTTASDVYALGIVLFELLTGQRPYSISSDASQLELERTICVTDPIRASATVQRAIQSGPQEGKSDINAIAAARGINTDRLQKVLIGDIDSIILRAMRKEPEHRYSSVEQLTADIRRYLNREPVLARQGNWFYYSQRFVRRHSFAAAAAAAFLLFITAFATVTLFQNRVIASERDRATIAGDQAEKVSDFMLQVFTSADPFTNPGKEITAQQLLDSAGRRIQGDLHQQPEVRARLLEAIGRAYRRQDQADKAIVYLEDALRTRRSMGRTQADVQVASILTEIAVAQRERGKLSEADDAFQQVMKISDTESSSSPSDGRARLLVEMGQFELTRGNADAARRYLERGAEMWKKVRGPRDPDVGAAIGDISTAWLWQDNLPMAEKTAREANGILESTLPPLHPDVIASAFNLANVLRAEKQYDEAGRIFERLTTAYTLLFGPDSHRAADTLDALAQVRLAQNRLAESEDLARRAVSAEEKAVGVDHAYSAYNRTSLAYVLARRGKNREAEQELKEALDIYSKSLPPDHQYVASAEYQLGEVQLAIGELSDAEATLTASMNRWERTNAAPWRIARSESALGEVLLKQKRYSEAEHYLVESLRVLFGEKNGADDDTRQKARERVIEFYNERGEHAKLADLLQEVTPTRNPTLPSHAQASR